MPQILRASLTSRLAQGLTLTHTSRHTGAYKRARPRAPHAALDARGAEGLRESCVWCATHRPQCVTRDTRLDTQHSTYHTRHAIGRSPKPIPTMRNGCTRPRQQPCFMREREGDRARATPALTHTHVRFPGAPAWRRGRPSIRLPVPNAACERAVSLPLHRHCRDIC